MLKMSFGNIGEKKRGRRSYNIEKTHEGRTELY